MRDRERRSGNAHLQEVLGPLVVLYGCINHTTVVVVEEKVLHVIETVLESVKQNFSDRTSFKWGENSHEVDSGQKNVENKQEGGKAVDK